MNILNAQEMRSRYKRMFNDFISLLHVDLDNYHYSFGYNDCLKISLLIQDSLEYKVIGPDEAEKADAAVKKALEGFDKEHLTTIVDGINDLQWAADAFQDTFFDSVQASVTMEQGTARIKTFSIPRYRRRFLGIYARFHKKMMEEDIPRFKKVTSDTSLGMIAADTGIMIARARTHMEYDIITIQENNKIHYGCSRLLDGCRLIVKGGGYRHRGQIEAANGVKDLNEMMKQFKTSFGGTVISKIKDTVAPEDLLAVDTQVSLRAMPGEYVKRVVFAFTTKRQINYGASTMKPTEAGVYVYDFNSDIASGFIPGDDITPYLKRFKNLGDDDIEYGS